MPRSKKYSSNQSSHKILYNTAAGLCLGFTALCVLFLAVGMTSVFGDSENVIVAFRIILETFKYSEAASYRSFIGFLLGAGYFVVMVFLVKSVFRISSCFKDLNGGNSYNAQTAMQVAWEQGGNAFMLTAIYQAACCAFAEPSVSVLSVLFFVLGFICLVYPQICLRVTDYRTDAGEKVCYCFKDALYSLIVVMLMVFMMKSIGKEAIYGLKMLFEGQIAFGGGFLDFLNSFYANLLYPLAVLVLCAVFVIDAAYQMLFEKNVKSGMLVVLIYTSVLVVLNLLFHGLLNYDLNNFSADVLLTWFHSVEKFLLPLLMMFVAAIAVFMRTPEK